VLMVFAPRFDLPQSASCTTAALCFCVAVLFLPGIGGGVQSL
jgi:hypothetical protein